MTFLTRCLLEHCNVNDANIYKSPRQVKYRALSHLIDPDPQSLFELWGERFKNSRKLKHISRIASKTIRPVDLIQTHLLVMAYLVVRWNPCGLSRPSALNLADPQHTLHAVRAVLEFIESMYRLTNESLNGLGYKANIVPVKAGIEVANHRTDISVQLLTNAIEEWSDLKIRVSYLMMHCDAPAPISSSRSIAPTSPSQTTRPGSTFSSLPYHTYLPYSHETLPSTTGFRRASYVAQQTANRASVSTLSSVDLGTPWDIVRATLGLVQL